MIHHVVKCFDDYEFRAVYPLSPRQLLPEVLRHLRFNGIDHYTDKIYPVFIPLTCVPVGNSVPSSATYLVLI